MSLASCIKKAGKILGKEDIAAIRQIHDDLAAAGESNPAQKAVDEFLEILALEEQIMMDEIRNQGGRIPPAIMVAKPTYKQIADEISIVSLLDGNEVLDIPGAKVTKAGKIRAKALQLGEALVARMKKANRGKPLDAKTPRVKEIVSEALVQEVIAAMNRSGHAGDWYSSVLQRAVNIAAEIHPELQTDPTARTMFLLGLAITSNGNDVTTNAEAAEAVYSEYKKTGKFLEYDWGTQGTKQPLTVANQLIERWGADNFAWFLTTKFTVAELTKMNFDASGEWAASLVHGSAIFGPKVGGGFFQNLMGNFDPVTMDRWFMRTWGRLTGTLIPDRNNIPEGQVDRFVAEIRANPEAVEALGWTVDQALASDEAMYEFAGVVHKHYSKSSSTWWGEIADSKGKKVKGAKRSEFKSLEERDAWLEKQKEKGKRVLKGQNSYGIKTGLNMAGKNLDNSMTSTVIAPTGPEQRAWIREVTALAIEKLNNRGVPMNAASLQALIWYPEKDIYIKYGVGSAKSAPTDYEQEFAKIARERGVDESRITAARKRVKRKRPAAAARDDGRDSGSKQSPKQRAIQKLSDAKRKIFIRFEGFKNLREQLSSPWRRRAPNARERKLGDADVLSVFTAKVKTANAYKAVDSPTPVIYELKPTEASAAWFHEKIQSASLANLDGAAVYVYEQAEYEGMRLFVADDGMTGFAIKDGVDLVSLFRHPDASIFGVTHAMVSLGVQEGGRTLDAFDTILPHLYSLQGFRVVSRIPWDENEKPDRWSKKHFKKFNNGEPDVVFMVYDRSNPAIYTGRSEGQLVDSFDDAVEIQGRAMEALEERNKPKSAENILLALPPKSQNRINSDPSDPRSMYHKIGATLEQQLDIPMKRPTWKWLMGLKDIDRRHALKILPRRYLGDFLDKVSAPAVNKYLELANRLDGRRNELQTEYEKTLRSWAQWANKHKDLGALLSELMHSATLSGQDVSKPYRPLMAPEKMTLEDKRTDMLRRDHYSKMKGVWDSLEGTGQEIYNEVKESYITMRKRTNAGLEARINASKADGKAKKAMIDELRKKFEAGRVAGVYFPLMRYGEFYAAAKDKKTGEVVSFSRFERSSELAEWSASFEAAGFDVKKGSRSTTRTEMFNQLDPAFAARVTAMAKELGHDGFVDEIWQMYLNSLPEMSMRKQGMHRKGRLGFAADALRGYATVAFRSANQQAKLEYMFQLEDTLNEMYGEMEAIQQDPEMKDFHWAMAIYDEMKERHAQQLNPEASAWAVATTGAGFLWFLGFTPAAAAVNLTQVPLVAFPVIAAEFNVTGASAEILNAVGLFTKSRGNVTDSLRGDERDAMLEARRIGLFEKTQAHDLAGVSEHGAAANYNSAYSTFVDYGSMLFHSAEVLNREVTFLAAYRLAIRRGDGQEAAIKIAEKLTWDSHFDYNNANRPVFMQKNAGRVIFLFKQYSLNMTYRMIRDFRDGFIRGEKLGNKNLSVEERNKAAKRFGGMMTMVSLFAGYHGLPFFLTAPIELMLEAMLGDEDEPYDAKDAFRVYLSDMFSPEAAEWIMKGAVDAGLNATLSSRVSFGQLWWRDPNVNTDGEAIMTDVLMDLAGPVISTVAQIGGTSIDVVRGETTQVNRAVEKMTPKVLRDLMRAFRYSTEGALTQHIPQDTLIEPDDFNAWDIGLQMFGFTPARLTLAYEQNSYYRNASGKLQRRMDVLTNQVMIAYFADDKKAIKEAWADIDKWNKAQPRLPINGQKLRRSMTSRARRHALSEGGINLPRNMRYLYDELSFSPEETGEKKDD